MSGVVVSTRIEQEQEEMLMGLTSDGGPELVVRRCTRCNHSHLAQEEMLMGLANDGG